MVDDNFKLTRRKILGAVGAAGATGALGGAGTMALFSDEENSTGNAITAGKLDLEIDWTEHYNGEQVEDQKMTDNPGPIFQLGNVKPGDYGEATISLHVFHNPAWIHMAGELTANDDNGLEEPEAEVDNTGGDGEGELADKIQVEVWYDEDGDNVFEDGEAQIACGTLREVLSELNEGVLLDGDRSIDGTNGGGTCTTSEELKIDKTPVVGETAGPNDEVEITGVHREEGEVVGIDWESNVGICKVAVKGGPKTNTVSYNCADSGTAFSTENDGNPNRVYYEISNVQFFFCDNGVGGGAQCFENSTTQYIGFSWTLPKEVGNEVQGDSVEFDLEYHAQQCRHNETPDNPYTNT